MDVSVGAAEGLGAELGVGNFRLPPESSGSVIPVG